MDHRPFFSVIVACYNPKKYITKLLVSIVNQHLPNDIELILVDDHSTEDYGMIVDGFKDLINIVEIETTNDLHTPGNTRQHGVNVATGEWICFLDQDDEFYPDTLIVVKDTIERTGEKYYCISDFNEVNMDDTIKRQFRTVLGWCHGKFYNLDNFWNQFGISFKLDLKTHEDIYICSNCNAIISFLQPYNPTYAEVVTYKWRANPESLTHAKYVEEAGEHTFLEALFGDYIESTAMVYLDHYERRNITREYALGSMTNVLCYCYHYMMGFMFRDPKGYVKKNIQLSWDLYHLIQITFGVDKIDIFGILAANDAAEFNSIRQSAETGVGPHIPCMTFMQWLDFLDKATGHERLEIKDRTSCKGCIYNEGLDKRDNIICKYRDVCVDFNLYEKDKDLEAEII